MLDAGERRERLARPDRARARSDAARGRARCAPLSVRASSRAPVAAAMRCASASGLRPQRRRRRAGAAPCSPLRSSVAPRLRPRGCDRGRAPAPAAAGRDHAALVPAGVGGQDQRRDLAGRGARRLHRDGGVRADRRGLASRCGPSRRRRAPSPRYRRSAARRAGGDRSPGRRRSSPSAVLARRALCRLARPLARPGPQCSSVAAGLPAMRA